ncbi:MAG: hypothetical protein ACKVX7_13870 [Planctomycetota bacterium]
MKRAAQIPPAAPSMLARYATEWGPSVFLCLAFGLFAYRALPLLTFPFELRYGEAEVLDMARRAVDLSSPGLYPPFGEPPYLVGNYPPVYPLVLGCLPQSVDAPFFAGRLLSMLAVLISAGLIALILRREGALGAAAEGAGFVGAGLFLSSTFVQEFGMVVRVDALGLAFGLAGMYFTLRASPRDSAAANGSPSSAPTLNAQRDLWLGAICFFLSVYTRHSLLALPCASYALLVMRSGWFALSWPLGLSLAGIATFLIGNAALGGEPYNHLIHLNQLPYRWGDVERKWMLSMWSSWSYPLALWALLALRPATIIAHDRSLWARIGFVGLCGAAVLALLPVAGLATTSDWFARSLFGALEQEEMFIAKLNGVRIGATVFHALFCLCAVFAVIGWTGNSRHDRPARAAGVLLLGGVLSAMLIGRTGSDVNYLYEYVTALCLCAAPTLWQATGRWRLVGVVLLALFVVGGNFNYEFTRGTSLARRNEIARRGKTLAALANTDGPILSEDASFVVILNRPLEYQPFMFRQLADERIWDPTELLREVVDRKFAAVVFVEDRFGFLEIDEHGNRGGYIFPKMTRNPNSFPEAVSRAVLEHYQELRDARVDEEVTVQARRVTKVFVPKS